MQEKRLKNELRAYGPSPLLARARWAPSGSATQTLTDAMGISSITRNSAGNYTVTLSEAFKDFDVFAGFVENDSNVHTVKVSSINQSAGTFVVIHETCSKAAIAASPVVSVTTRLADVSTPSSAFVAAPIAGTVSAIYSVLGGAISSGDAALSTEINGVAITGGTWTVAQSGSAAGDRDSATPTAANTVAAGDTLEVITDGGSTDTATLDVTFVITGTNAGTAASDSVDQLIVWVVGRGTV